MRKAFRILGLDERKDRGVNWSKIFMEIFRSFTELCSFWYGLKELFTLYKLADKAILDN